MSFIRMSLSSSPMRSFAKQTNFSVSPLGLAPVIVHDVSDPTSATMPLRAASRVPWFTEELSVMTNPKSIIPNTMIRMIGSTNAASTIAAPRLFSERPDGSTVQKSRASGLPWRNIG